LPFFLNEKLGLALRPSDLIDPARLTLPLPSLRRSSWSSDRRLSRADAAERAGRSVSESSVSDMTAGDETRLLTVSAMLVLLCDEGLGRKRALNLSRWA
jgi:hypothetical protein